MEAIRRGPARGAETASKKFWRVLGSKRAAARPKRTGRLDPRVQTAWSKSTDGLGARSGTRAKAWLKEGNRCSIRLATSERLNALNATNAVTSRSLQHSSSFGRTDPTQRSDRSIDLLRDQMRGARAVPVLIGGKSRSLALASRMLDALTDPARRDRTAAVVLLGYVALWTLYAAIAKGSQDIHVDMSEQFVLSRELAWGYPKHPPLPMGIVRAWFAVVPT